MTEWWEILVTASFWVATVRIATPFLFGTLGELICERAGVLNLGIEGIMVLGALAGWLTVYAGGGLWWGVAAALAAGAAAGLAHGFLTATLGLSQHVSGIGITLLATSMSYFFYRVALPNVVEPPRIQTFANLPIPFLSQIPVLGEGFFNQSPLTYIAYLALGLTAWVLYRTPVGLAVRMAGENPAAVEAQGLSVNAVRIGAVMAGSALMGLAGAFLTLSAFNAFFFNMINGRGWICIALVVFGGWKPWKAALGALLFAAVDSYQLRLQQFFGTAMPYQIFLMLPYLLSIAALIAVSRRATFPRALMIPYRKGER